MRKYILLAILFLLPWAILAQDPQPGAPGIGDPYYPLVGNGGYDVQHYTVELAVDMSTYATTNNHFLTGTVTLEALATQDLSTFNLDFFGMEIDSILVNDLPADFRREGAELVIIPTAPLANGELFSAAITYHGSPEYIGFVYEQDGWISSETEAHTFGEPFGTLAWMPVNDHPLDKATYTFRITVAAPYVVAANGLLQETITNDDGTLTYVWEASDPIATYLAHLHIAEFTVQTEEGPDGLPIRNYFSADVRENEIELFATTSEMIAYFNQIFGPYPFEAYGVVVAEGIPWTMEAQTLSMFDLEGLRQEDYSGVKGPENTVVHELAHQWFGDCVSVARWQDIWLSEGFASYAEVLWLEHAYGAHRAADLVDWYYNTASFRHMDAPAFPWPYRLLDSTVYRRGALVLQALRTEVGDETFLNILRAYVERLQCGNAATDDFIAVAEEISGQDLTDLFADWLYSDELPFPTWE